MARENIASTSWTPRAGANTLRALVGRRVVALTRWSWWSADETVARGSLADADVFSFTAGALSIEFDNSVVLGISSDSSLNSISFWIERDEDGHNRSAYPLAADEELFPISVLDERYHYGTWRTVIGASVKSISVLIRKPGNAKMAVLPNEVAICFYFDNNQKIIGAHGLHDDSDDFVVICDDQIHQAIRPQLEEISIS